MGKIKPEVKFWQYLLSFVKDIPLEVTESEYHPYLAVLLSKGRHQLVCQKAIYSFDDKYDNFRLTFLAHDFEKQKPKTMLLMGLGLASIPYMLETVFDQPLNYTIVEIDDEIIYLAQKYTLDHLKAQCQIYNTDAADFAKHHEGKYDIIVIDLFAEDIVPNKFKHPTFFNQLDGMLTKNGVIMYNLLAFTDVDKEESLAFVEKFKQSFPKAVYKEVKKNYMVFNHDNYLK